MSRTAPALRQILLLAALFFPFYLSAQSIRGKVTDSEGRPLEGASVYWLNAQTGTVAGSEGGFEIAPPANLPAFLVAGFVGRRSDTLEISGLQFVVFELAEAEVLREVTVRASREGIIVSNLSTVKTEQITQTELRKAACCDLAGCFETQSSVHPQTTNVLTNSKELRILGLSGVYNQVLLNGLPMIQGLTYTYGISSIPGSLVANIFVSKGANSVLQGFESISGQINVETKDPATADNWFLNAYINSFGERHLNADFAFKKGKWSNLTAVHAVRPARRVDRDLDGFLDLPLLNRLMVSNHTKFGKSSAWGWSGEMGLRFLSEARTGGQKGFFPDLHQGSNQIYGQQINLTQPEGWLKAAFRVDDNLRFAFQAAAYGQEQDAFYGVLRYDAAQKSAYANLQVEWNYGSNELKAGTTYRYLSLDEDLSFSGDRLERTYAGNYERKESIPGLFAENTLRLPGDKLTWLVGARLDHHNTFGAVFTPRTLLKFDWNDRTTLRANIGKGWRTVNLFSENIPLLASSRDVVFLEPLRPEKAVNYGLNITRKFGGEVFSGYLSADYYRTVFQNQVFPDYDSDPTRAFIKNFEGGSVSNGAMLEVSFNLQGRLEMKTGYTYLDVYHRIGESQQTLPFIPRHRFVSVLGYTPVQDKLRLDANVHWYGRQRLPDTQSNPEPYRNIGYSPAYAVANAQATVRFPRLELYGGCENLFDFRQQQPITAWQDPFGPYFDTSSVWGPTRGREWYIGVRLRGVGKSSK